MLVAKKGPGYLHLGTCSCKNCVFHAYFVSEVWVSLGNDFWVTLLSEGAPRCSNREGKSTFTTTGASLKSREYGFGE